MGLVNTAILESGRPALLIVSSLLFCFNEADRLCAQSSTAGAISHTETAPNGTELSHHTTQANGVRYHYALSGSGPITIVLLHGWPVTWYHWHAIIPKLAERYTVVAPDLRGLGLTAKAKGGYDKRTVAGDIYELVKQLGHEHAYVVGHDIGGMVAFAMAHEYPAMVQKLVPGAPSVRPDRGQHPAPARHLTSAGEEQNDHLEGVHSPAYGRSRWY